MKKKINSKKVKKTIDNKNNSVCVATPNSDGISYVIEGKTYPYYEIINGKIYAYVTPIKKIPVAFIYGSENIPTIEKFRKDWAKLRYRIFGNDR